MPCSAVFVSPLGPLLLVSDGSRLLSLRFVGSWDARRLPVGEDANLPWAVRCGTDDALPGAASVGSWDALLLEAADWLRAYFAGRRPDPRALPLAPASTPFAASLREALLSLPFGRTLSYGALAALLASSPRAVGSAVGRNPFAILVPCHRVLGAGGKLTGYAWGLARKRALLDFEGCRPLGGLAPRN